MRAGTVVRDRPRAFDWRSRVRALDWRICLPAVALCATGVLLVWSSTRALVPDDPLTYLRRQLGYACAGLVLMAALAGAGHWSPRAWGVPAYLVCCAGLLAVLTPLGLTVNGSTSWLGLGAFRFQPSEPAKPALVLALAALLGTAPDEGDPRPAARLPAALAVAGVPIGLVMLQPDLGTALILSAITLGMLLLAGTPWRWIGALAGGAVAAAALAWWLGLLKPHQVRRLMSFVDPAADPQGAGYNAIQALETLGSGGLLGHGLFHGDQTGGRFVPEQHTDFVYTVAGEELGFTGASAVLVLLWAILWRGLRIAARATTPYDRLVAGGIVCWLAVQSALNIGMVLGLAPIVGVPLPLVSYGGSSTITCLAALGVLMSIGGEHRPASAVRL
ncbi:rod shape-determining protein RodA [Thermostaphylospora chromogena]|uniref:peptidoglycan glycosyltransferase n=1 Tax=Thermostaphylospora chromogena TaxID=35622 RepID=A0A1H1DQT1_9ACTN|nr:rod shape-determining protein RodA [Thermostaphylospora chromogena]SDQ78639.1 rod shape determining protein RodA [Thermostaphylospora chromogena]